MSHALPDVVPPPPVDRLKDVWSRSGSKYRVRAVVLLALNVFLFAGLGSFAFWLRSGIPFAPAMEGYGDQIIQTFSFGRPGGVTLGSLLLTPISVQRVEMQIWVLGLLMAALISMPILTSILYRFWASLPFLAIVALLAVMPWLAITLLGSCLLASVPPFRSRFRFMSAMFGLVPAVVYLILAWGDSLSSVAGIVVPADQIKLLAPWVLAIVASSLLFAIVLTIARWVDYRPGAVTPLLALMFGLPAALFEFHVGRDELYYRLLESLHRAHYADVDATMDLRRAVTEAWNRHPLPRPRFEAIEEIEAVKWQFALTLDLGPYQSQLVDHQQEIVERCDAFGRQFPTSRYMGNVLYLRARALDMRVDPVEFDHSRWIRFYDGFPSSASRETWRTLVENRVDGPLAIIARLRLAQLEARDCEIDRARDRLARVLDRAAGITNDPRERATPRLETMLGRVATREPPESSLAIPVDRTILEARRLLELIRANRDPIYGDDPLCGNPRGPISSPPGRRTSSPDESPAPWFGLLDLNPRDKHYAANLRRLKAVYPHAQTLDNIELELALTEPATESVRRGLQTLIDGDPGGDAVAEALFRLGSVCRQTGDSQGGYEAWTRLTHEHPDSVWVDQLPLWFPADSLAAGAAKTP